MSDSKLKQIASGSNSCLWVYDQGEGRVVLKAVESIHVKQQRHLRNQYNMLKSFDHPNVIKALKYQENVASLGNTMDKQLPLTRNILVLEHASEGNLLQFIQKQKLSVSQKKLFARQIATAISVLHSHDIAHRDIKLQNVLVTIQNNSNKFKCLISDFGFATKQKIQGPHTCLQYKGTKKAYMAPQIHYCLKNRDRPYDPFKTDIFALGVLMFALFAQKLPFQYALQNNQIYSAIVSHDFSKFWSYHSSFTNVDIEDEINIKDFKNLFEKMISFEPNERPTIEEVLDHSWFE